VVQVKQMKISNNISNGSIIVRRQFKSANKIVIDGVIVPEEFYEPAEASITEDYFFEKCLPAMEEFGPKMARYFKTFPNNSIAYFSIIKNIDSDLNPWAKKENMSNRLKLLLTLKGEL
jgi:hypothetical protein